MVEAFIEGGLSLLNPTMGLLMIVGLTYGIMIGILPGIGTTVAMAIVLPFIFGLKPEIGIPFLLFIFAPAIGAGTITSILLNMPGEPSNVATVLDGFPMTKKGEAGRALGAAFTASAMGGLGGVCLALALIPLVMVIVRALGSPEQWAVVLIGVAFIAIVGTAGSVSKAFISASLGFLLAMVGFQANTGVARFTFGTSYLYGGLPLIGTLLGLFAIPALIETAQTGSVVETGMEMPKGKILYRMMIEGAKDVFRHIGLWARGVVIGFCVGLTPAVGGSAGVLIAYGQAVKTSKHPERFGTGTIEGVIAPESCNNAVQSGALTMALALGIPGNVPMMIILGAFIMMGLAPGPTMLREHLPLCFSMLWTLAIGNVAGCLICLLLVTQLIKLAYLKADYLVPILSTILVVGVFAYQELVMDVVVFAVMAIVCYFIAKFGYSRPAVMLGFILGPIFEKNFFISLSAYGPEFLLRPIVLGVLSLIVFILFGDQLRVGARKLFKLVRG